MVVGAMRNEDGSAEVVDKTKKSIEVQKWLHRQKWRIKQEK
ncbi:hypothetical protein [Lysinibacillus fusiformis]|nr:hypothetical protein [Lysinibacillus fusiformis]